MAEKVSGYGNRPSFKDDASAAMQVFGARAQRISHLNAVDVAQRVDSLVGLALIVTDMLSNTLETMKGLAIRLQDETISEAQRTILADEFDDLNARINDMTAAATFAGLNLINPDATDQADPITLPSGQQIAAHDLRKGQGIILPLSVPVEAPQIDSLMGAFALEGSFTRQALGTSGFLGAGSYAPVTYSDGESGGQAINATYSFMNFRPTSGATVSASFQANQPRNVIQHIVSGAWTRDAATIALDASNNLVITGNGKTITGPTLSVGQWYDIAIAVSETGKAEVYLDRQFIGDVQYLSALPTGRNSVMLYGGENAIDNLSVYSRQLSSDEISDVSEKSQRGIQNWRAAPPNGSDWGMVADDLTQSLANLRNVETYYAGVAKGVERYASIQQRLADNIDASVQRLVVPDLDRLAAKQAAADTRAQLALATMGTQRAIMNNSVILLAGTLEAVNRTIAGGSSLSRFAL